MKTDAYTKTILTIIAIALIALFFKSEPQTASASEPKLNKSYALVPVNADGSVNVKLTGSGTMDVNIAEVQGSSYGALPVEIKRNDDK